MPVSWHALYAKFVRQTQTLIFFQRYRDMRKLHLALEPFPDPRGLFEYLRGPSGTREAKNRVLNAALIGRRDDPETAGILLVLALWPALDHAYRNLCRGFGGDPKEVATELLGSFGDAVMRADPAKVKSVAATLIMNAKRDATQALTDRKQFASQLDSEIEEQPTAVSEAHAMIDPLPFESDGTLLRKRLEEDFGTDASLVYDVAVNEMSQRDLAERMVVSHDAVRKRYQRAIERIRQKRPDYLAPRVPLRSPSWHLSGDGAGRSGTATSDVNAGKRRATRTASGTVPPLGTPRDPADRRRVPHRNRRRDD